MNRKVLSIALTLALTFSVLIPISVVSGQGIPNPDHIFYVTYGGVETMDPAWAYDTASGEIIQNIYEPLCAFDEMSTAAYTAKLADSWPGYGVNMGDAITPSPPHPDAPEGTNQTWYFHIRTGVQWHDLTYGTVTPYDVEYSIERGMLMDHTGGPQWMLFDPLLETSYGGTADWDTDDDGEISASEYSVLEYDVIHAVDANSTHVWFNLPGPYAPFQQIISQSWGMIICKEWAIEHDCWTQDYGNYEEFVRTHDPPAPGPLMTDPVPFPVGTGPYKLAAYNPDPHTGFWTVEKNDDYWGGWPAPGSTGSCRYATVKLVEEWANRKAQFFSTDPNLQADFCEVPRPNVGEMHTGGDKDASTYPGFRLLYPLTPAVSCGSLFFNYYIQTPSDFVPLLGTEEKTDLLSDRDLRLAIIHCLNVTQFIDEYWLGEAVQPTTCMPPGRAFYNESKPTYNIDIAKAEQHFLAAWDGRVWSEGITLAITYNEGNTARETEANMLEDVIEHRINWPDTASVDIRPLGVPWSVYIPNMFTGTLPCFTLGWLEDYPDPHNWFMPYMHSQGDFSGVAQNVEYGLDPAGLTANWYYGASYGPPPYTNVYGEIVTEISNEYVDRMLGRAIGEGPTIRQAIYEEMMDIYYAEAASENVYNALTRHYERTWINGYEQTWNHNPISPGYYFYTIWKEAVGTVYSVDISATDTIEAADTIPPRIQVYEGEMRLDGDPAKIDYNIHVAYVSGTVDVWVYIGLKRTSPDGTYYFPFDYFISLGPGEDYSATFTWYEDGTPRDVTNPATGELGTGVIEEGDWTISLVVQPTGVPGGEVEDSDLANNQADHAQIVEAIEFPADLDGTGIVDIFDIASAARAFGTSEGHDRWDEDADIDENGTVDIFDIASIARMFGKTLSDI